LIRRDDVLPVRVDGREQRRNLIHHKRLRRGAARSVVDASVVLDHHPIETNRD
jgi:hypothetical protein